MTILEDARAVLAEDPVCDACVGRVFADRSFGLGNDERGHALRVAVALDDDEPYEGTTVSDCWVCEGRCGAFDDWADRVVAALGDLDFETYQVGTRPPPLVEENDALLRESAGLDPDAGEPFKAECNREVGKRVGEATGAEVDFTRPDVQVLLDIEADAVDVTVNSAFVYGRYRKLERGIPQTEWPCRECDGRGRTGGVPCEHCGGSGYMYDESVEQLVAPPIVDAFEGDDESFHGAGREDVDALMLGTGRPFVLEVDHPRVRRPDLAGLADDVAEFADGAVEVEGLRHATYEMVERVKELDAAKTYRAEVAFDRPVDREAFEAAVEQLNGAVIQQETPERVSHRRAALVRERTAYEVTGDLADDDRLATVEVHGEGGLYIKELVSGDHGRTNPSLAGLVGEGARVTALDVVAVEGEDEPFEDEDYFR